MTPVPDDSTAKRWDRQDDIAPEVLINGHYKVGANELGIYRALVSIIDMLEAEYGFKLPSEINGFIAGLPCRHDDASCCGILHPYDFLEHEINAGRYDEMIVLERCVVAGHSNGVSFAVNCIHLVIDHANAVPCQAFISRNQHVD